jgi:VIT1/CCC1 family predicted Fe2+/Mn2+ transporter
LFYSLLALLPVIPFFFIGGVMAILLSATLSAIGLFIIGAAITLFTGKNVLFSGFRQVAFGLIAAAITFGIGHFIGVSIAG